MTEHRVSLTKLAASLANGGHSIFSPSGSAMWTHCSGSLVPNLLAPDDVGFDAAEGTVAHGIGELWLKTGNKPSHLIGKTEMVTEGDRTFEITITEEMLDYVQMYEDLCSFLPGNHYVETKVYFSHLTPIENQGGTADHAACMYQRLVITDLKYGRSPENMVFARDNTQALLYAIGFFNAWDWLYDFQEITIRICQPRLDHFDEWTITRAELLSWEPFFRDAAHAAWQINAPRRASPKACRWCKVKNDCAAHLVLQGELMEGVFENLEEEVTIEKVEDLKERIDDGISPFESAIKPMKLTDAQIGMLLPYRSFVESWWKAMAEEAERRAVVLGRKIPGTKLVESRSNRRFVNEHVAGPRLIAFGCDPHDVYSESMVSPAQAEDLLVKAGHRRKDLPALLNGLVMKPPGKPTLVPESDRRTAIADVTENAFSDLTQNPEPGEL
jgi:hypothetical protein